MQQTDIEIQKFLDGHNDKKHVVAIECDKNNNMASLVIHDPNIGKFIETQQYTPFIYMMDLPQDIKNIFYKGDGKYKSNMLVEHGINIKQLRTHGKNNNNKHERLVNGYKFLVESSKSFNDILTFFRKGGINVYDERYKNFFVMLTPQEQFMVSTGIRMFKGFDLYSDIHKLVFDIETTGLDPNKSRIFLIGLSDNRGFETVIEVNELNDDDSERKLIVDFFNTIEKVDPAIIYGYNSENFDFSFILKRAEILKLDITKIKTTLKDGETLYKRESSLKLGGDTEIYNQTIMWGRNIIDTYFSVRRAQAIDSEIKEAGLKYITKFNEVAKPNRMYIEGEKIFTFWKNNHRFITNPENNEYEIIPKSFQHEAVSGDVDTYSNDFINYLNDKKVENKTLIISGQDIVRQYLLDDLWETQVVDAIYSEATFMFSKWLPTTFNRTSTIGGSSSWNLIMIVWSYENGLALPKKTTKRRFVGGLSRLLRLGYMQNIVKADYAGLYPSIQLEHNIFPKHDVDNVLYRLLKFFKETRDVYKKLAKKYEDEGDSKHAKLYDAKQKPIKILNNSNFGANGSEYFLWSDMDVAERITCTGRQYLRKMCEFFVKYGFRPVLVDTDGVNFETPEFITKDWDLNEYSSPKKIEEISFIDNNGELHVGLNAFFEKLNQDILASKYMKVDNDGMWLAGINIARKNYVSFEIKKGKEKLKLTGNSIKSKKIPKFMEVFLKKGLILLIKNKPKQFVDLYYQTAQNLYYRQLSLMDVASKAKVRKSIPDYVREVFLPSLIKSVLYFPDFKKFKKEYDNLMKLSKEDGRIINTQKKFDYIIKNGLYINDTLPNKINSSIFVELFSTDFRDGIKTLCSDIENEDQYAIFCKEFIEYFKIFGNKNGKVKAKQAHMDLIIENDKIVNLGDVIHYVNSGTLKSHADSTINKKTGKSFVTIIDDNSTETIEYNVSKYISDFNKKVEPLLIVFKDIVRESLLTDKPLEDNIRFYTNDELELSSWDIDTYTLNNKDVDGLYKDSDENVALFRMEDREVEFWNKVQIHPKTIYTDYMVGENDIQSMEYYDVFFHAKEVLKKHNMNLMDIKSRHENGQIYLKKDGDDYWLTLFENNEFKKLKKVDKPS